MKNIKIITITAFLIFAFQISNAQDTKEEAFKKLEQLIDDNNKDLRFPENGWITTLERVSIIDCKKLILDYKIYAEGRTFVGKYYSSLNNMILKYGIVTEGSSKKGYTFYPIYTDLIETEFGIEGSSKKVTNYTTNTSAFKINEKAVDEINTLLKKIRDEFCF